MRFLALLAHAARRMIAQPGPRRTLLFLGAIFLLLWLAFFDSHSIVRRASWYAEHRAIEQENARMQQEVDALNAKIEAGLSDEVVEQIAREHYGMRREGETVYRVKRSDEGETE